MNTDAAEDTDMDIENTNETGELSKISCDKEKRLEFYVQKIKLAVAVAVIRSTPPKMTSKMYASHLIQCFREDNNKWKDKCEILERELIVLGEKLETVILRDKFNIPDVDMNALLNDKPRDNILKQSFPPTSSNLKTKICNTIDFVRSFIFLGSVTKNGEIIKENEDFGKRVLKSISLLFEYLRSHEGLMMEFEILKSAMEEVRRLFDSQANFFEKDLIEVAMNFVDHLLLDIYLTLEMNMVEYQHRRSMLIQMLAEQKKLTILILSRLLREITIISDSLVTALHSPIEDLSPLLRIENAYYVLQTAEGTLHIMRQQKSALNIFKIPKFLLVEWDKTTGKSLLDIGSNFSMYTIYVWHIKTLLRSVFDLNVDN